MGHHGRQRITWKFKDLDFVQQVESGTAFEMFKSEHKKNKRADVVLLSHNETRS
jgi:hypothetical protein